MYKNVHRAYEIVKNKVQSKCSLIEEQMNKIRHSRITNTIRLFKPKNYKPQMDLRSIVLTV